MSSSSSRKPKSSKRPAARPATHAPRRAGLWLLAVAVLGIAGGWWQMKRAQPEPPVVTLDLIDPTLRQLIETSRVAVAQAPRSGAAWGRLGEALEAAEFGAPALFCYSNAALRDPQNFRWPYLLGLQELKGNQELALQHLNRAVELAGNRLDSPRFQLARALVQQGQFDKAEPHLQTILGAHPGHAAARVELARVYMARGALREATLALQSAFTNDYTMKSALLLAAQVAQRNQQADLAAELSRRAAPLPRAFDWPDPVLREVQSLRTDRVHMADQANNYLLQQRLPEAEAALQKLLSRFPDDPEGLLLFGRLRYLQRRCAEAEGFLRQHIAAQPDSLNGYVQLGLALMCQQRWTNAIQAFEKAVAIKPDLAQGHSNLGLARAKAGDADGSIRAFRDGLRCNPGDINSHMNLAEALAKADRVEEARQHIRSAEALDPNDPRLPIARKELGMNPTNGPVPK